MGPAVFARKFMSPVVPAFIIRQSDGTHKIEIYEPIVYNDTEIQMLICMISQSV